MKDRNMGQKKVQEELTILPEWPQSSKSTRDTKKNISPDLANAQCFHARA